VRAFLFGQRSLGKRRQKVGVRVIPARRHLQPFAHDIGKLFHEIRYYALAAFLYRNLLIRLAPAIPGRGFNALLMERIAGGILRQPISQIQREIPDVDLERLLRLAPAEPPAAQTRENLLP